MLISIEIVTRSCFLMALLLFIFFVSIVEFTNDVKQVATLRCLGPVSQLVVRTLACLVLMSQIRTLFVMVQVSLTLLFLEKLEAWE